MNRKIIWQDKALMIIGFSFAFALIPSIISEFKPAVWSCLLTALGLTAMVIIFFSLKLRLTALANTLSAIAWWILFIQSI